MSNNRVVELTLEIRPNVWVCLLQHSSMRSDMRHQLELMSQEKYRFWKFCAKKEIVEKMKVNGLTIIGDGKCKGTLRPPLKVDIIFYLRRPASLCEPKYKIEPIWATIIPDIDNMCKAVLDACKGIVFPDDNAVVALNAKKMYNGADNDPPPGIFIRVEELDQDFIDTNENRINRCRERREFKNRYSNMTQEERIKKQMADKEEREVKAVEKYTKRQELLEEYHRRRW